MDDQHRLIKGYRDLTQDEIDLMNEIKAEGQRLEELVGKVRATIPEGQVFLTTEAPSRWVAIATTDFQTGLMALTRAVARPTTF